MANSEWVMPTIISFAVILVVFVVLFGIVSGKKRKQRPPAAGESHFSGGTVYSEGGNDTTQLLIHDISPPEGRKYVLILSEISQPHRRFEAAVQDRIEIGRAPQGPGITIEYDPRVSKRHCSVTYRNDGLWLEDMGSTNKTFINEEIVLAPRRLNQCDVLTCGKTKLEIRIEKR